MVKQTKICFLTVYAMHLVSICQCFLKALLHAEMCIVMRLLFICSAQGEGLLIYAEVLYHRLSPREPCASVTDKMGGKLKRRPYLI